MTLELCPGEVRFTHGTINCKFACGRALESTYEDIPSGRLELQQLPWLTVTWHDERWFTFTGATPMSIPHPLLSTPPR